MDSFSGATQEATDDDVVEETEKNDAQEEKADVCKPCNTPVEDDKKKEDDEDVKDEQTYENVENGYENI